MGQQDLERLQTLKSLFPEDSWPWAAAAFRYCPQIWTVLEDSELAGTLAEQLGPDPARWTPGGIGGVLINQEYPGSIELPLESFDILPAELKAHIHNLDQEEDLNSRDIPEIQGAFLQALGLMAERQAGKSWFEIAEPLAGDPAWQLALVCVFNLVKDPTGYLRQLDPGLALKILLSNPFSPEGQADLLAELLVQLDLGQLESWFTAIQSDLPDLAPDLARSLLDSLELDGGNISEMLLLSFLNQLAGNPEKALNLLEEAAEQNQRLRGKVTANLSAVKTRLDQPQTRDRSWQDLKSSVSRGDIQLENYDQVAEIISLLLENRQLAAVSDLVSKLPDPLPDHPALLVALAQFAHLQDHTSRARELAEQALELAGTEPHSGLSPALLKMGLYAEAARAAESYLDKYPNHMPNHLSYLEALKGLGDYQAAADAAQVLGLLHPQNLELQRQLAELLELAGNWQAALEARAAVLARLSARDETLAGDTPALPEADLLAFARSALRADHFNRAVSACGQILAQNPDCIQALALKGQSLCALGENEEGLIHLQRALDLDPQDEASWISQAGCQADSGRIDQAQRTLKSGLAAARNKAAIYLELARLEARQNHHSQALEYFRQAETAGPSRDRDDSEECQIQLGIARSQQVLGHTAQAAEVLRRLTSRYPRHLEANYLYGRLLLEQDCPDDALPYLITAVDQGPQQADVYLAYADALLQLEQDQESAARAVDQALEIQPGSLPGQLLASEVQAAAGDYRSALTGFQSVQESKLISDPHWSPRISLGLGNSALQLGEVETAIAALKDGLERFPDSLKLARGLAVACQKADLIKDAVDAARASADIAPEDPDNLAWVAEFTLELGSPEPGIKALENLIRINPDHTRAYLLLGKAQAGAGNLQEAARAFAALADFEDVQPDELLLAGEALISQGEVDKGFQALQTAINICEANPEPSPLLPTIWAAKAEAFRILGDDKAALDLLDEAIAADLDQPAWRIRKADLLLSGDRPQAAIASLSNAIDLDPHQPALHLKLARVQAVTGSYEEAYYHAQEALAQHQTADPESESAQEALALAADLASSTLRTEAATQLVGDLDLNHLAAADTLTPAMVHSCCLAAELSLDQEQEVKAAEISNLLISRVPDHPRVSCLQARILNRQGSRLEAEKKYQEAQDAWVGTPPDRRQFSTAVEIALSKTALELQRWEESATHMQHAVDLAPREKRSLTELARIYILLAESRRLFETMKVLHHAPDPQALSSDSLQSLLGCLDSLAELPGDHPDMRLLEARGRAAFTPSEETAAEILALGQDPADQAAGIAAYRHSRQLVFAAREAAGKLDQLGQDHNLDAQIALALMKSQPDQAFRAAYSALEAAKRCQDGKLPVYFALQAMAARSVNDRTTAAEAMSKALQLWDNEPRWYALAAEIEPEYPQRVEYLQKAIQLEPEFSGHYLSLGRQHLKARQPLAAAKSFEAVLEKNPEHVEAWIERSLAKRNLNRMPEALESINRALELAPEHTEAQKTAALLSFENGKYRDSEKHLVALLGQEPNDTELLGLFARTLTAQKNYPQAQRVIEQAISLEPDNLDLQLQKASMIKGIEGPSAAVDQLRIIGSQFPDRYPLLLELVAALAEAGELDQAIRTALDALQNEQLGPTPEQKAHLYLTTGRLLRNNGQLDQAVHHLYKAKNLLQPNFEAVLELGRVHHDRRQYSLALEQIQRAIDIEPDEAEGYYQAGRVLKDLKNYREAEKMLRKAAELAPNDLKIHRQLGVLVTLNLVHGESRQPVAA